MRNYQIARFCIDNMRLDVVLDDLSFEDGKDILFKNFGKKLIDLSEGLYVNPLLNDKNIMGFFLSEDDVLFIGGWFEYVTEKDGNLYFLVHQSLMKEDLKPNFVEMDDILYALN